MAATHGRSDAQSLQEQMNLLADTGECIDFWDIEVKLRARGYSRDATSTAMAEAETRRALNARCHEARMGQHRRA